MTSRNLNKNFFVNLLIILLIFFVDRLSKIYVIFLDEKSLVSEIFSSKYLNINLFWNEGIAFGLFSFENRYFYNILTIIILIIIFVIFLIYLKSEGKKKYFLIMILGGALGNVFDRIFYQAVPDFIDFHVGNFHWFIFNVADIFITIGLVFMIFFEIIVINKETN